jgi:hypothetical protein
LGYVGYKVPMPDFRLFAVALVPEVPIDEAHRWMIFEPIPRIDVVEPSDDSLLELCAAEPCNAVSPYLVDFEVGRSFANHSFFTDQDK